MSIRARARACLRDPISGLAWENLGITPVELVEVSGERNVCSDLLIRHVTFAEPLVSLNSDTLEKRRKQKK